MRLVLASLVSASLALGMPLIASGQTPAHHAKGAASVAPTPLMLPGTDAQSALPVWQTADGRTLTIVTGSGASGDAVPGSAAGLRSVDAHSASAGAGLQFSMSPSLYGRADVRQRNWLSNAGCGSAQAGSGNSGCLQHAPLTATRSGEIGAGYANNAVKLDLSVGQSRTTRSNGLLEANANLPRVLPTDGAAIAAPLLFPDSTSTDITARGQIHILPDTQLDLGASRGRVHFLPSATLPGSDDLNQTTISLGVEHGPVSGTIVGRTLQPALPGGSLDPGQRWSGIDLGVSVRLPWQGELSFGAQNVWSSGKQPLLNPQDVSPDQTRVPYVQYHQEL